MRGLMALMKPPGKRKPSTKPSSLPQRWNIVRGDIVIVNEPTLKSYGEKGTVKQVMRKVGRIVVDGVNMGIRRFKTNQQTGRVGGSVMMPRSLHYSNVNLVDPVSGLPTKITREFLPTGEKVRVAKGSGAVIPKPEKLSQRRRPKSLEVGMKDTTEADAWMVTYVGIEAKGAK